MNLPRRLVPVDLFWSRLSLQLTFCVSSTLCALLWAPNRAIVEHWHTFNCCVAYPRPYVSRYAKSISFTYCCVSTHLLSSAAHPRMSAIQLLLYGLMNLRVVCRRTSSCRSWAQSGKASPTRWTRHIYSYGCAASVTIGITAGQLLVRPPWLIDILACFHLCTLARFVKSFVAPSFRTASDEFTPSLLFPVFDYAYSS